MELEKTTGIAKSSLQRYASGATLKIPLSAIEKISAAFGVPPSYIIGWDKELDELSNIVSDVLSTPGALRLMKTYMSLDDAGKKKAEAILEALAK